LRDWRRRSRKQYQPTVDRSPREDRGSRVEDRGSRVEDLGSILEYTGQQIESGLTRIETANNWTLTVTLGAVIAVTSADSFPDPRSMVILVGTIGLTSHFMVRAMKGYINVVRFGLISRSALELAVVEGDRRPAVREKLSSDVITYGLNWQLPITRQHVWVKALSEFSFGYVYLGLIGVAVFTAYQVPRSLPLILACSALLVPGILELVRFHFRSPYMRLQELDEKTIHLR
jgi:hypothetical protein